MSMTREEAITRLKCWLSNGTEDMTSDRAGYIEGWFVNADVRAFNMAIEALKERPHGECKTCKYYSPYREQFSYRYRGDGYCKSNITNSEGVAYINCHDNWYCANYEKGGDEK